MKKDAFFLLLAGTVLGAVIGFIATRQYYVTHERQMPAPQAQTGEAGAAPTEAGPGFDPEAHRSMIDQMKAELEKDPTNLEKRIMLANIYYDAGRFAEAAPLYEEAMKIDPKNTDVVVDLGVCLRNQGKFMEALSLFQKAEQMEPNKKQALFNTVVVYAFDLKDRPKALEALKRLEAEFPGDEMIKRLADEVRKTA